MALMAVCGCTAQRGLGKHSIRLNSFEQMLIASAIEQKLTVAMPFVSPFIQLSPSNSVDL